MFPSFYNKTDVANKLQNELFKNLSLNITFQNKLNYNFFPRPHFTSADSIIQDGENITADIKKIIIYISLDNLLA